MNRSKFLWYQIHNNYNFDSQVTKSKWHFYDNKNDSVIDIAIVMYKAMCTTVRNNHFETFKLNNNYVESIKGMSRIVFYKNNLIN